MPKTFTSICVLKSLGKPKNTLKNRFEERGREGGCRERGENYWVKIRVSGCMG